MSVLAILQKIFRPAGRVKPTPPANAAVSSDDSNMMRTVLAALDRSQARIEFSLDGTILDANTNFLNAMSYELHEIQGRHHRLFVSKKFAASPEYAEFWQSLRSGHFQSATYKRFAKGGREVWIQATYNPVVDESGQVTRVIKYATDITEQTRRNAKDRGRVAAIDRAQAVISFEADGTILSANDNFLAAMGYSLEEIVGQHHRIFVEPKVAESKEYGQFWGNLRRGEYSAGEFKRVAKGGREIWIQATYNPILDPDGNVVEVVKFATDVTAQVRARHESARVGALVDEKLDLILVAIDDASAQSESAVRSSEATLQTVQGIAAATTQFESSALEISGSMERSRREVERAIAEARGADESTQNLTNAAQAMNSVVDVIQGIAGQIKLLSLNATIEAASAGESGKGFAVVASEVKSLASEVAKATDQISSEIDNMQHVCDSVVQRIDQIRGAVEVVDSSVSSVAQSVVEQANCTQDIATKIQSTASVVATIHGNVESITSAASVAKDHAESGNALFQDLREFAADRSPGG